MGLLKDLFSGSGGGTPFSCPYCGKNGRPGSVPLGAVNSKDPARWIYNDAQEECSGGVARSNAEWYHYVCWDACCTESHPPIVAGSWCYKCMGKVSRSNSDWEWERSYGWVRVVHKGKCPPRTESNQH